MLRKCPYCNTALKDNCYLKDNGTATLSYLELIIKDEDLKKENFELNVSYCPQCGHVETWIALKETSKKSKK